jgi:hypothetical protein
MEQYGYTENDMHPLTADRAVELFDKDHTIYLLYPDNTEEIALDREEIINFGGDGLCGITHADWEASPVRAAQLAVAVNSEGSREADFLYGDGNKFGIYQIRDGIDDARDFRFAPMRELEALGLSVDCANYELVYTAPFSERIEFLSDRNNVLNRICEDFNLYQPSDFTGHSLSVSDVVVLKYNGDMSTHYVDSVGFSELDNHSFFGEERIKTPDNEKGNNNIFEPDVLPQDSLNLKDYTGSSVAELEAEAKTGNSISLMDLSKAVKAERQDNRHDAPKTKPTLMERLDEGKQKASRQGQPDAQKDKEREV